MKLIDVGKSEAAHHTLEWIVEIFVDAETEIVVVPHIKRRIVMTSIHSLIGIIIVLIVLSVHFLFDNIL
jgi:hypothetical protein